MEDFAALLRPASSMDSRPLAGKRIGLVTQTLGEGVQPEVEAAVRRAAKHLESLGAVVEEVSGRGGEGWFWEMEREREEGEGAGGLQASSTDQTIGKCPGPSFYHPYLDKPFSPSDNTPTPLRVYSCPFPTTAWASQRTTSWRFQRPPPTSRGTMA